MSIVLEVAVFYGNSSIIETHQRSIHKILPEFDGFIDSIHAKGHKPSVWADLVLWETLEQAKTASKTVQHDHRFGPYFGGISRIDVFGHYQGLDKRSFQTLADAPIIELAGYEQNTDIAARENIHHALSDSSAALIKILCSRIHGAEGAPAPDSLDLIGWKSMDDHHNAPKKILARYPKLAPVFDSSKDMTIIETFSNLR